MEKIKKIMKIMKIMKTIIRSKTVNIYFWTNNYLQVKNINKFLTF